MSDCLYCELDDSPEGEVIRNECARLHDLDDFDLATRVASAIVTTPEHEGAYWLSSALKALGLPDPVDMLRFTAAVELQVSVAKGKDYDWKNVRELSAMHLTQSIMNRAMSLCQGIAMSMGMFVKEASLKEMANLKATKKEMLSRKLH